ncbi:hypothetical protein PENSPDRAFT_561071, partial [Peniophora sp. CONT]
MSRDVVTTPGPSIIQGQAGQLGPQGPRSILGALRGGNHDCEPSCQFSATKGTCAVCLIALRDIPAGEEITVSYKKEGYYYEGDCLCATCTGDLP